MSSTIETLSNQIQKSPEKVTVLLPQMLDILLKQKSSNQIKQDQIKKTIKVFIKIIGKIDQKKQKLLSEFMCNMTVQLIKTILYIIIQLQSQDIFSFQRETCTLYDAIEGICTVCEKMVWKDKLTNCLLGSIEGNDLKINISNIKNGYVLLAILRNLKQRKINQDNLIWFQSFLLGIENLNEIKFPQQNPQLKANQIEIKSEFKQIYQQLFIKSLEALESLQISIEDQTKFYNRLGDKIFSKLTNPLILSQFFIQKFRNEDQNPSIQIEILSCLFILVGKHGLQLQKFYQNLEKMISKKRSSKESIFRLSNSKRFLKLIEAAMRTSKIPFKNILTLSHLLLNSLMNQPSELTFWFLSFFVNLVKKYICSYYRHRHLQTRLSQFPVLQTLKYHYSPVVRSLIKQLQKNLNKAQYLEIEDFTKVNCKKICDKKFKDICKKIGDSEERLQFKLNVVLEKI